MRSVRRDRGCSSSLTVIALFAGLTPADVHNVSQRRKSITVEHGWFALCSTLLRCRSSAAPKSFRVRTAWQSLLPPDVSAVRAHPLSKRQCHLLQTEPVAINR